MSLLNHRDQHCNTARTTAMPPRASTQLDLYTQASYTSPPASKTSAPDSSPSICRDNLPPPIQHLLALP
ncbi:hypothetical protein CNMCM5793_000242 [Aspergillus hiratsukae]|uniref:Uncharacterized protein n=1 Tax=Aspergillus hiratsukae TaxID=1194566 RepID=A0A8H6UTG8_9EURO|nr:hypothetical protein CNMCM5793_000242 [Aspergillus hiratsukae]KAF7163634.1 hypothetical protein CNMCM6106_000489 [Aspergillus hiratsukae]